MKRHLNTLYITNDDAYLRKDHETFIVELDGKKVFQAPIRSIENIVCFGFKPVTPALMAECAERQVGIAFLSPTGQFLARVQGEHHGNVLLRKAQYAASDDTTRVVGISRVIVAAKVTNYRTILLRHLRNHPQTPGKEAIEQVIALLAHRLRGIERADSLDTLRGYEGECARAYFSVAAYLLTAPTAAEFWFVTRSRRPPLDRSNALLSFLYALITNDIRSALEAVGLDPYVGFFHRLRPGRPSLALDLLEELRAYLGDRTLFTLVNRQQVQPQDFEIRASGEVRLTDTARKTVLSAYQQRKQEEILHPFLGERVTVGLIPHIQAQLLARYLRGDMEMYVPFTFR
ncbi:MAG: type I-C CRISPR-associated endonuclease Cas1c [Bacteroidota bacterium]|nr:type I-C CRISPR-associated endonuclease Cas1c [Bacteroidota bacterium]